MLSRSIKFLYDLLIADTALEKLYFFFVSRLTGLKIFIYNSSFSEFYPRIREKNLKSGSVVIKKLKDTSVLVREKDIDCKVHFDKTIDVLKQAPVTIRFSPSIDCLIKWKDFNIKFFTRYRNYLLGISANIKDFMGKELALPSKAKLQNISPSQIELVRKVRVTEEIIGLSPYVRKAKKNTLYKVPVIKKPLYKSHFTSEQINNFREILAKQSRTIKANIEIISIYDKFNVESYSVIKQDPESKGLICYLNDKLNKDKFDDASYYLVIGQKKDTREIIKALAMLE